MCIISNPVEEVTNTKILIVPNTRTNRQLTIYSNEVFNKSSNNAMILPVPNPQTVMFHNLSSYPTIFKDCKSCFYSQQSRSYSTDSYSFNVSTNSAKLEVIDVGSYQVSLAMSLSDLKRVDTNVFTLSSGCEQLLAKDYSNPDIGFIICKLADGNKEYHPFGYSHNIYKNILFIPTKHYHDHSSVQNEKLQTFFPTLFPRSTSASIFPSMDEDWSHEIYLYNATADQNLAFVNMSQKDKWTGDNKIKTGYIDFEFEDLTRFEKHRINGSQKNIDLFATVNKETNEYYKYSSMYGVK